jgi:hypothetical protein
MKPRVLINLWVAIALTLLLWSAVAPAGVLAQEPEPGNGEVNGSNDDDDDDAANGAHIELRVQPGLGGAWTVVQWQDGMGRWHDVDGWRAQIESDQAVNWWVAPKHLDTGPYRWLVYREQDRRAVVWASELFYLPKQGDTLVVTAAVSMQPAPGHPQFGPMMPPEGRPPDSVMPEKQKQPGPDMPEKQKQPDPVMPEKQKQPDSLMPNTGSSVGIMSRMVTTAFSAIAALGLLAGGLVAAFRKGFTV